MASCSRDNNLSLRAALTPPVNIHETLSKIIEIN